MNALSTATEKHYHHPELYEDIVNRLTQMGIDLNNVSRKDIASVDEFHVRGAEVSKELATEMNLSNAKVLDVGCGIGGPCRMLAEEYNCNVTGIDLSQEFIRTAEKLSALVKLSGTTNFVCGDACNLPYEDKSFDVAWTQHVQMNVQDKPKFYTEINRVLNNSGTFIYYDIFKNGDEAITYPMPWAGEPDISFLQTTNELEKILKRLNLKKIQTKDQTEKGIQFFENMMERMATSGPPKLGLHVVMGESTKTKIGNLLNALKENKLELQSGIYKK